MRRLAVQLEPENGRLNSRMYGAANMGKNILVSPTSWCACMLKYRIAGFISGIFIPMRTPKRGFT